MPVAPSKSARLAIALSLGALCIALDQWTKHWATEHLRGTPQKSYLGDTLRIHYAENPGAFLGFGTELGDGARFWLLTVATGIFVGAVAVFLVVRWRMELVRFVSLVLIVAGGIGNLIDRAVNDQGRVVDFLNVGLGGLRTGIFNVADIAITTGVIVLFLDSFRKPAEDGPEARLEVGAGS